MSTNNMALSAALSLKLRDGNIPLSKRLFLAKNAFESQELEIQQKENIIFNWLLDIAKVYDTKIMVWGVIKECLESNRLFQISSNDITSSVKSLMIKGIGETLQSVNNSSEDLGKLVLFCATKVLGNIIFQQYLSRMIDELFYLLQTFFNAIASNDGVEFMFRREMFMMVTSQLNIFNKMNLIRGKLNPRLIKEIFPSLHLALNALELQNSNHNTYLQMEKEFIKAIQHTILSKQSLKDWTTFINSLFESDEVITTDTIISILSILIDYRKSVTGDVSVKLYNTIFKSVIGSVAKDHQQAFKSFSLFCFLIGFQPFIQIGENKSVQILTYKHIKKLSNIIDIKKPEQPNELSLKILKHLVDSLSAFPITLGTTYGSISFEMWFQALTVLLVKDMPYDEMFTVVSSLMEMYPLIFESNLGIILKTIIFGGKYCVTKNYIVFFQTLIQTFSKLHRLQKLISKLLLTLKVALTETESLILPLIDDVLPEEFLTDFGHSLLLLPSSQICELLKTFIYHFKQDCLQRINDGDTGDGFLFYIQSFSVILSHFLCNIRIAEHTVPVFVLQKFSVYLDELKVLLGLLGQAVLQLQHKPKLMVAYLRMCHSWGQLSVLLCHYSTEITSAIVFSKKTFEEVINNSDFSNMHSYLSAEQWNLIAQRINNFGEAPCKSMLNKMILQKLQAAQLFCEFNKISSQNWKTVIIDLTSNLSDINVLQLNGIFSVLSQPDSDISIHYAHIILKELIANENSWNCASLEENRVLTTAITWCAFENIRKLFNKTKRKLDNSIDTSFSKIFLAREILSLISPNLVNDNEEDHTVLSTILEKMACQINNTLITIDKQSCLMDKGITINVDLLKKYLELLQKLPLLHFYKEKKSVVFLSILAIFINIVGMEQMKDVAVVCMKLMIGLLESDNANRLCSSLKVGILIPWINSINLPSTFITIQNQFVQRMTQLVVSGPLDHIKDDLVLLDSEDVLYGTKNWEMVCCLLHALNKKRKRHIKIKEREIWQKHQKHLSQKLMKIIKSSIVDNKSMAPNLLKEYNLILTSSIASNKSKRIVKAAKHLPRFFSIALNSLTNSVGNREVALNFLSNAYQHHSVLNSFLPQDYLLSSWKALVKVETPETIADILKLVVEHTKLEEYEKIGLNLIIRTKAVLEKLTDRPTLQHVLNLWQPIVLGTISSVKNKVRDSILEKLANLLLPYVIKQNSALEVSAILKFLTNVVNQPQIHVAPAMFDLCFTLVMASPLTSHNAVSDFVIQADSAIELLRSLLLRRTSLTLDRIPILLQCFRTLVEGTVKLGNVEIKMLSEDILKLSTSVHSLEKLTKAMVKYKKDFTRISPYIVGDILQMFLKNVVHSEIKFHLQNTVNSFLSLFDQHAVSFVMQILPPASKEVFKSMYEMYKKYHKFTGKL